MPLKEGFLSHIRESLAVNAAGVIENQRQDLNLTQDSGNNDPHIFNPVRLGHLTRFEGQWQKDLLWLLAKFGYCVANRPLTAGIPIFIPQAVEDSLGRVSLLARRLFVQSQPGLNNRYKRPNDRRCPGLALKPGDFASLHL